MKVEPMIFDDVQYEIIDGTDVAVVAYNGSASALTIPTTIVYKDVTYNVTVIGEKAFYNNQTISSISLPNSITIIKKQAFAGCSNLSQMNSHD